MVNILLTSIEISFNYINNIINSALLKIDTDLYKLSF